ncbi:zinc ribbon domain-containing protein [Bacteroides sp. 224]|uniref:zinc ribbon domain-containing protein n=1 Tax=Bacteroides sp. 224 TaxID=2302936 RepID=UPI0013D5B07A|nr:zinc ribbon domain-containing protein [Bacteroides sp. 224]NDV66342.1 zinc ribbon domain-containing protein [Bacteroides sp. 224]
MKDFDLLKNAVELVNILDKTADGSLPQEIADIVKFHTKGATVSALATAWIPGVGSTAALVAGAGFVWGMYLRINTKIGLTMTSNIVKTLASGVLTNLAAAAATSVIVSSAMSFFPGIGNVGASAIMAGTVYAATIASGVIYLKVLTNLFKAGKNPEGLSAEELKNAAKRVTNEMDVKEFMNKAKKEYKKAKEAGEFDKAKAFSICESCGAQMEINMKFCPDCGARVKN